MGVLKSFLHQSTSGALLAFESGDRVGTGRGGCLEKKVLSGSKTQRIPAAITEFHPLCLVPVQKT